MRCPGSGLLASGGTYTTLCFAQLEWVQCLKYTQDALILVQAQMPGPTM